MRLTLEFKMTDSNEIWKIFDKYDSIEDLAFQVRVSRDADESDGVAYDYRVLEESGAVVTIPEIHIPEEVKISGRKMFEAEYTPKKRNRKN